MYNRKRKERRGDMYEKATRGNGIRVGGETRDINNNRITYTHIEGKKNCPHKPTNT